MVKWCNGVTKYAFTLVWCYGETNILKWCREYTNVHMVKWWNTSMKWCNNKDLHIIMVKWCNKSGEIVLIIQTSSHGKMVKQTSRDTLSTKWQNGETVILTVISPLFNALFQRWGPSLLLESIRCCIYCLCISCLWEVPSWSSNCNTRLSNYLWCHIPLLLLIDKFLLYLTSSTTNIGGVRPLV